MEKQVYKCECGFVTHFKKALEAHCRFRKHHPKEEETILSEIKEEVTKAVKQIEKAETKTRKPRAKKTAAKEQK